MQTACCASIAWGRACAPRLCSACRSSASGLALLLHPTRWVGRHSLSVPAGSFRGPSPQCAWHRCQQASRAGKPYGLDQHQGQGAGAACAPPRASSARSCGCPAAGQASAPRQARQLNADSAQNHPQPLSPSMGTSLPETAPPSQWSCLVDGTLAVASPGHASSIVRS